MKFQRTNEPTILEFWDYDQQKAAENFYKAQSKEHNIAIAFLGKGVL